MQALFPMGLWHNNSKILLMLECLQQEPGHSPLFLFDIFLPDAPPGYLIITTGKNFWFARGKFVWTALHSGCKGIFVPT